MASAYSPYKIEYMATGEDDGTWGDITNQNFTAFSDMINGQATINFASADVVLTLTDTNAFQAARCLRLVCSGVSGGARNLTVPAIPKEYLVWNGLADLVTVKTPAGTGIAIPAGRSALVYCDGTNVSSEVTYTSSLSTGDIVSSGSVFGQALYFNNQTGLLNGDATANNLIMSVANNALFQTNKATGNLNYYVNANVNFNSVGATGDFGVRGNFFVNGTSLSVGPSNIYQINTDAVNNNIVFDTRTPLAYIQYNLSAKSLQYVAGGNSLMTMDAAGNMALAGKITATSLVVPAGSISGSFLATNTVPGSTLQDSSIPLSKWQAGAWFLATNGAGFGLYKSGLDQSQARWVNGLFNTEGSGSVGSDYFINCYDNAGNFIATPITIQRSSGNVAFQNGFTCVAPANFSSSIIAQGSIQSLGTTFFGTPSGNQSLAADSGSTVFNVNASNCYFQYIKASGVFNFVVNGVVNGFINNSGEIHARTWLVGTNFGTPDGIMQLVHTNNAANGTLYFDTRTNQTYISWDGTTLWFTSAGANTLNMTAGAANFNVNLNTQALQSTRIGCSGQGFFTGNLNAAQNNGVAANCVIVGFFQSGAYYNANVLGINVAANTGILGYNGGAANAFWSTSPSDRRLKENIERPSRDALDVVRNLPVWSCDYVPPKVNRDAVEDPDAWPEVREHWAFSFMADEVEAAIPNATIKHEGASVALHPNHLIATLWAAVQQLTDRLESAEATIKALEGTRH